MRIHNSHPAAKLSGGSIFLRLFSEVFSGVWGEKYEKSLSFLQREGKLRQDDKTWKDIFTPTKISYGKALVCLYINICACLSQWWCPVIHNSFVPRELPRHVYIKTIKTQKGHGRERCNWNGDYISSSWRCALEIFKWKSLSWWLRLYRYR